MKIGVFDSGVGGKSVARAIQEALPELEVIYADDSKNVPYGIKSPPELLDLTIPILSHLKKQGCQVIVIACNTVTTTIIEQLRAKLDMPLVAIEPMIKPAAMLTKSGVIAVCATPATLASRRYKELKATFAKDIRVLEPDCSDWAAMIETKANDHAMIQARITEVCEQGSDVIVLGCTHYHWIEADIQTIADSYQAQVIQPEQAIVRRLKQVLEQRR